jgi:hypothetical protein
LRAAAALNNAEWCDIVCRSHGLATRFAGDAWTSPTRAPQLYPDAVTLASDASAGDVLARIDATVGCSVKDSFASLDLSALGFRVLFDAEWIVRAGDTPAPAPAGPRWEQVRGLDDFARWKRAWSGEDGPTAVFRDELLDHHAVSVLAARDGGRVVAGAILNRSERVVGVSNFFAGEQIASACRRGLIVFTAARFPGSTLVGYESGDELAAARESGFEVAGPLRVWIRDGARSV